jgi:uncharacterized Zn finger protein (UPF0148 family)
MPDMDKVMMALECLADGQTCACCDYKPYDDCSRRVARDAIELLKELADKAITDDASIPEQFWPSMRYDPSDDVVACTSCLICGKDIPLRRYESGPMVCSECKEVIALLKEQEAKEVKELTNMYTGLPITHCPKCGISLDRYLYGRQYEGQINYCPMCGQAVKWE